MKGKGKIVIAILAMYMFQMGAMSISPALSDIQAAYPERSATEIQMLVTLTSFFIVLTSLCADSLARKYGKKNIILVSAALFTIPGIVPTFVEGYIVMLVSRALIGLGIGLMLPLAISFIYDFFDNEDDQNKVLGWQTSAGAFGSILMTLIGGMLTTINYKYNFAVHLLGAFSFICVLLFIPQDKPVGNVQKDRSKVSGKSMLYCGIIMIYFLFFHSFATNAAMFVAEESIGDASFSGIALSLLTVGSFLSGLVFGKLASVCGKYTLPLAMLISTIGLVFIVVAHNTLLVSLSGIVGGFGMGTVIARVMNSTAVNSPPEGVTKALAYANVGLCIGQFLQAFAVNYLAVSFFGETVRDRFKVAVIAVAVITVLTFFIEQGMWKGEKEA